MMRRALPIVATVAGIAAIVLLAFLFLRPKPPAAVALGAPAAPGQTPQVAAPTPPPLPAKFRANTIVPFPESEATYTNITVDIDGGDPADALATLAGAANLPVELPRFRPNTNTATDNLRLHLKDEPFLEALLQLQAQSGLRVNLTPTGGLQAQYPGKVNPVGIWSITGPFAYILTSIDHTIPVGRDGHILAGSHDIVNLEFNVLVEPQFQVLRYPMSMKILEATDDHGNSLTGAAIPMDGNTGNVNFPVKAALAYPSDNPGRRIKHLRGTASYLVRLKSEPLVFTDPFHKATSTKEISGMKISAPVATWEPSRSDFDIVVTFEKGGFDGDWAAMSKGLASLKPAVVITGVANPFVVNSYANTTPNKVEAHFQVNIPATMSGNPPVIKQMTEPPPFETMTLDIPLGLTQLDIPVEFNDLPLP